MFHINICYDNYKKIANIFAKYLSSVFRSSSDYDKNSGIIECPFYDIIKLDCTTYEDVTFAIKKLKSSLTSAG